MAPQTWQTEEHQSFAAPVCARPRAESRQRRTTWLHSTHEKHTKPHKSRRTAHERSHSTQHWTQTARTAQKGTKNTHSQVQGSAQVDQKRPVSECDPPETKAPGSAEGPPGIRVVRRTCSKQRPLTSETARALCRPSARIWIRDDDSGHSTDPTVISTGNQKRDPKKGVKRICDRIYCAIMPGSVGFRARSEKCRSQEAPGGRNRAAAG